MLTLIRPGLPFCGDTTGPSGAFDIELVYLDNGLSSAQKNLMTKAARRWEQVIIGDLPDISYRRYPYNEWDDFLQARIRVSDTVDDVRIFVRVRPIASQTTTGNPLRPEQVSPFRYERATRCRS